MEINKPWTEIGTEQKVELFKTLFKPEDWLAILVAVEAFAREKYAKKLRDEWPKASESIIDNTLTRPVQGGSTRTAPTTYAFESPIKCPVCNLEPSRIEPIFFSNEHIRAMYLPCGHTVECKKSEEQEGTSHLTQGQDLSSTSHKASGPSQHPQGG